MKSAADIGVQTNRLSRAAEENPTRQARINSIGGTMYRNLSRLNYARMVMSISSIRERHVRDGVEDLV